jgi:MFS family permease
MPAIPDVASSSLVNHDYPKLTAWVVTMTAALFFFYEFIQMNFMSSLNLELIQAFHIHATQLGILTSSYFIANIIFLLPAGQLLDRFSTRKIILTSMSLSVAGTFLFSLSDTLLTAAIFRFMTGIGCAFCFLSSIRLASHWFPPHRMALVSGLIVTMAMFGGWIAQTPFTKLIEMTNWRTAVQIDAGLGVLIICLIIWLVSDYPPNARREINKEHQDLHHMGYLTSLKLAYFNRQNIFCGLYTCLMNLPVFLMGAIWGSLYLEKIHGFTPDKATMITGMIFFGTVIGSPLAGWISDKLKRRKLPMIIGSFFYFFLILMIIYIPNLSFSAYLVSFFFLGLITSTQVISYPMVAESNPMAITATSISLISLLTVGGGGAFFIPFFGWLMDVANKTLVSMPIETTGYSAYSFYIAMLIMPITAVIALLVASLTQETYCERKKD